MQPEIILCKFGQICATGNATMHLETIICKFAALLQPTIKYKNLRRRLKHFGIHPVVCEIQNIISNFYRTAL